VRLLLAELSLLMPFFSIIQWNVESRERLENISSFLNAHRADVICLQELTIGHPWHDFRHAPRFISQELNYQCSFVEIPNTSPEGAPVVLANAILTGGNIQESKSAFVSQSDQRIGFEYQSRAYLEAQIELRDKLVTIGTTHLGYSDRFRISERRKGELQCLVNQISRHTERFVLAGDFNAEPESYVVAELTKGLSSVGPDLKQPTWTTKPFSYRDFYADRLNWRLDYIFATRDVAVLRSEILDSPYSDHLPIYAELSLD
jgi:endonuclease/exonuclease/phosphatase family metal-dependent hydrolase